MSLKTSDLCDACPQVRPSALSWRGWGRWAGLVIHGTIRDGVKIDAMDIGLKALGTVPQRGDRTGQGQVDVPVSFGGATFVPGRRMVADEDGVIVLPQGVHEDDVRTDDVVAATAAYAARPA